MKSYKMQNSDLKLREQSILGDVARDTDGRLYLKRFRELFDPLQADLGPVEALAALRYASRMVHLLQERWGAKHGLSEGRLGILFRLYRCGDLPLGELADELVMSARNVTGLMDHLERQGFVERVPDSEDRRSIRARLTRSGREVIESIWKEGHDRQVDITDGMSKEDLAQLRHLCLLLVENARKELGK
jgi:DNA-binding MarR family transcriptional regulator